MPAEQLRFFKKIMVAKSALNEVAYPPADLLASARELTYYIVGSAGIASGAVQLEGAHDWNYAGTWAADGAAINAVASTVAKRHITGCQIAHRVRISTVLAGGTIDVWVAAN